jgi:hypothetical protein
MVKTMKNSNITEEIGGKRPQKSYLFDENFVFLQ